MRPLLQLISGGRRESKQDLRELYERYGPAVLNRCRYLLKDASEAEDAMQDVFAKALTHLDTFRSESSPLTWLTQIATRHCLNLLRARKAQWHEQVERIAQLKVVGEAAAPLEGRDLVRALLARFDAETQNAAVLYYVDEMTLEEVARCLERSVPTVRKRLAEFAEAARAFAAEQQLLAAPPSEGAHG